MNFIERQRDHPDSDFVIDVCQWDRTDTGRPHIDALNASIYDAAMRTTIDLDPDVDARLRALARERGVPLRTVINDALRAGTRSGAGDAQPYTLPSHRLGVRPGIDLDKALRLAGELEDDETVRKLDLRK